jgi:hypothetical protein
MIATWLVDRNGAPFTMGDLLEQALGVQAKAGNPTVTVRVAAILEDLGYERKRVAKSGVRSYVYALPVCPPASPAPLFPRLFFGSVRRADRGVVR